MGTSTSFDSGIAGLSSSSQFPSSSQLDGMYHDWALCQLTVGTHFLLPKTPRVQIRGCKLSSTFWGPCRLKERWITLELILWTLAFSPEMSHRWAQPDTVPVSVPADLRFSIWISFFEIYNELLYDLLEPPSQQRKRQTLRLCEDQNGNPYVKGMGKQWLAWTLEGTLGETWKRVRCSHLMYAHLYIRSQLDSCSGCWGGLETPESGS